MISTTMSAAAPAAAAYSLMCLILSSSNDPSVANSMYTRNPGTAKNMKQLLKDAKALNNPALNKNLKLRTIAQLANYAYSGIVLGFGVPFLNISITNGVTKKRNAKKEHENIMKTSKDMAINNQIQQSSFAEMKKNYSKTA